MPQLPKPFQRPGISLSDGTKREWRDVKVETLRAGDLVREKGAVESIGFSTDAAHAPDFVAVRWRNRSQTTYSLGDTVHAFVQL